MAKLNAKLRKAVAKAEPVVGFKPLDPGLYIAKLSAVTAKNSSNGNPMWSVEFDSLHTLDGEKCPGRQWANLMIPNLDGMPDSYEKGEEKWEQAQALAAGRLKGFFEAFGVDEDEDTDNLIGKRCVLRIAITTIQAGPKKGQATNRVEDILNIDEAGDVDLDEDDEDDKF